MPKGKSANPVAAQRKAEKRKEIAKSKKSVQEQRNEKLARRNPDRLQKQIDELKELDTRNQLRPKDKETLAQLERDLRGVKRAREALGDAAPKFPSHERRSDRGDRGDARREQRDRRQNLGKRRRDADGPHSDSDGSDTDPEVRNIPMPRDTPPPMPRQKFKDPQIGPDGQRVPHALPTKPAVAPPPAQLVYSSAPQLRDLKKEATKFVPATVRQKQKQIKGQGRLLEPEEIDKLEQAGYYAAKKAADEAGEEAAREEIAASAAPPGADDIDMELQLKQFEAEMNGMEPQQEARSSNMRQVQLEDVDDDGD